MDRPPLVTCYIATYNRPDALAVALEGLARQTFKDFEVIVVDDAGADVAGIVAAFPDLDVELVIQPANMGAPAAHNVAIARARGELLLWHDDDDFLTPCHLDRMVQALGAADGAVCDAELYRFTLVDGLRVPVARDLLAHELSLDLLKRSLTFTPTGALYRKSIHEAIGPMDESFRYCYDDWDFFLRAMRMFKFVRVPVASVCYAVAGDSVSGDLDRARPHLARLMAKHGLAGIAVSNFGRLPEDPLLAPYRRPTTRVWDGQPLRARVAP